MVQPDGDDVSERRICHGCVEDETLRAQIKKEGKLKESCDYCGARKKSLTVEELAHVISEPLREFCAIGPEEQHVSFDSDKTYYEQRGESLGFVIQEEGGIDYDAAEDLARTLAELDPARPQDGEDPFFSTDQLYERLRVQPWDYVESWEAFATRARFDRRFFDPEAEADLGRILGAPGTAEAAALPIRVVGPGQEINKVIRARVAESDREAAHFLANPVSELGPPPSERRRAGRMNAAGIGVFYGALSEKTAVAEIRPSVGGIAVVGTFTPTRDLRLLDLTVLGSGFSGSIFAPSYGDRAARLSFLQGFHGLIARPVLPHEEALEYVPTQIVAEYVANILGFDGIIYGSAQVGALQEDEFDNPDEIIFSPTETSSCNVVLMGEAARIAGEGVEGGLKLEGEPICVRVSATEVKYHRTFAPTYLGMAPLPGPIMGSGGEGVVDF